MHFYLITMAKTWNYDQSLKKKWFYWRHFFLFLACFLVYGGAILFYFILPAAMLPCLCILAKNKSGNNTRKGGFFNTINFKPEQKQETQEVSQES